MPTTDTATKVTCPFCGEPTACAECGRCTNSACEGSPERDPYCTLDGLTDYERYLESLGVGELDEFDDEDDGDGPF